MRKIGWGKVLAGLATAAAAGAAYVYLKQRAARGPFYEVLASEGEIEIRRYPAQLTIETEQQGSRDRALGNGFGLLARYMFGEGREGEEIPIVMPVLAEALANGSWRISFVLPQGTEPTALERPEAGVSIREIAAREVAAIPVSGRPTDRAFSTRASELRRWIKARGRREAGGVIHAYHNSPLKPGTTLPNEVLVPLT